MNRLFRLALAHMYLYPEIELQGGVKIQMTDEQAATYQAARTKDKAEREALVTSAGAAKAVADQAKAAAEKAESDRVLAEAAKTGELAKVRELASKESRDQLAALATHTTSATLRAAIHSVAPTLDGEAVTDILSLLSGSASFDVSSRTLVFKDAAGQPIVDAEGKPKGADAHVRDFLTSRKHFQHAIIPPASNGGKGAGGAGGGAVRTMTVAEHQAAMHGPEAMQVSADIIAKKIKVVD